MTIEELYKSHTDELQLFADMIKKNNPKEKDCSLSIAKDPEELSWVIQVKCGENIYKFDSDFDIDEEPHVTKIVNSWANELQGMLMKQEFVVIN